MTSPAELALRARALEYIGANSGAVARRGEPSGDMSPSSERVAQVERMVYESRINLAMWVLHRRCTLSTDAGLLPADDLESHRDDAVAVVDALLPPAVYL